LYIKAAGSSPFDAQPVALYNINMVSPLMSKDPKVINLLMIILSIAFCIYYYGTLLNVPFHPDEATYIFMSHDFEQLLSDPQSLKYKSTPQTDLRQHYRLVDPALTRYIIGAGLAITHITPLPVDWDWSLSWQENQDLGALPDERMLTISRLAVSIFFLFSLVLIFKTGVNLHSSLTGLLAVLFLGTNALILLHSRRAMEEALLLPTICLSLYCFASINKRPWLAGFAVMLAINVKLSAAPLFFMGALAIFILDRFQSISPTKRVINLLIFTLIILVGTYLLNPVFWFDPLHVIQIASKERASLVSAQVSSLQQIDPAYALTSLDKRIASLITHLFLSWPAALDIGNYLNVLKPSIDNYLSTPGTTIMRGLWGGLVYLILMIFGFILMLTRLLLKRDPFVAYRAVFLFGFVILFIAMSATISLPFQRYVIPLLPFTSLLSAFGLSQVILHNKKAPK
jgi:hypothetical protein